LLLLQSTVKTIPLHAIVLLIGVPMLLAALNTMWFVKIVRGAYKLVFKKQVQQQPADTITAAAVGKGGKQLEHMAAEKTSVSILAYAGSGAIKGQHFE
jgi:hypothetical protein